MQPVLRYVTVGLLSLLAAGCGGGGHESHGSASDDKPTRTIDVVMREFAYEPAAVTVKAGETVKFVFRNNGSIVHDAFLGDEAAQAEHEREMAAGDHHDGHAAIKVDPGQTGELTHTFDKAGKALIIGCHETGHYAAGMKMTVTVT